MPIYHFGHNFLIDLKAYFHERRVVFIVDHGCWHADLQSRLSGFLTIVLPGGEQIKTLDRVANLLQKLWQFEIDRTALLVVVGGGAVLDMVGFVASCYMRGIDYCLVPSTLLSQVDAAIGGKTAINFGNYKNLFGTFAEPIAIVWDYSLLQSLPDKHFRGAMAEIIKHAAIKSPKLWQQLQFTSLTELHNSPDLLAEIIQQNVQIKTQIITQDFREYGERKILNFGHSLAHALEQSYHLEHSEAVAIGMSFACRWSVNLIGAKPELVKQMHFMLKHYQLPTEFDFDWELAITLLKMDKKRTYDKLQLILLLDIGNPQIFQLPLSKLSSLKP